jgi:hypothetical protein
MKLKEWGLMRHKPRKKITKLSNDKDRSATPSQREDEEQSERDSSATVEPMLMDLPPVQTALDVTLPLDSRTTEHCTKQGRWQIVADTDLPNAEPSFMGMLHRTPRQDTFPCF